MAIKRYKRVGTTMIERSKGPWVLWEDVKDKLLDDMPIGMKAEDINKARAEVKKDGERSDNVVDSR